MIKAITEQNASPIGIYIHRKDLERFPETIRKTIEYWELDRPEMQDIYPKSYYIFLATELKASTVKDVIVINQINGLEEIWSMEDTGLEFESVHEYRDDALKYILKDCNMSLGNVIIGNIKFD